MTTGKTIALTRRTFVGKLMSLLFSILSTQVLIGRPLCLIIVQIISDLGLMLFQGRYIMMPLKYKVTAKGLQTSNRKESMFHFGS